MHAHVHSGNGKLTLLSYFQYNAAQAPVHARGFNTKQLVENSPYFHTYSRAYMQYALLCLHVDLHTGKGKLTLLSYLMGRKKNEIKQAVHEVVNNFMVCVT